MPHPKGRQPMKANPSRTHASSLILVVSLIVATAWETTLQARQNQPPPAAAADVQLWVAALEQLQREQNKDFALANETLPSSDFVSYLRNVTREQDLVDKLLKRNESSPGFLDGVASSTTELIDVTAIRKPGAQDIDWIDLGRQSRLRKKLLVRLSLPVFSEDHMRALVWVWASEGFDASMGGGYVFQKRDNGWIIVDYLSHWIN